MNVEIIRDYFERVAPLPHIFGVYDCCTFVVETLLYGFDRDYRDALRYFDRRSAIVRLRAAGGLREAFCDVLGPEQLIADGPPGSVAYFEPPHVRGLTVQKFVGIIMPGYIAAKGDGCIHRFVIYEHLTGWRTD